LKYKYRFRKEAIREAMGKMTEVDLAKQMYRSSSYVTSIEKGDFIPTVKSLVMICNITGRSPKFFFEVVK
jgi:transcriptional regulator with XRE-family HTH domain